MAARCRGPRSGLQFWPVHLKLNRRSFGSNRFVLHSIFVIQYSLFGTPMVRHFFPPMPQLGQDEAYYKGMVKEAEAAHQAHAREAAKVGQYVTLGIREDTDPESKMKFFRHALKKHCVAPAISDAMVEGFYERLGDFVRLHAGREALRVASIEDDRFA